MILTRNQADGVIALNYTFQDYGYLTIRCGVANGVAAHFVSFPNSIRITKSGVPEENYASLGAFIDAYAGVV